MAQPPTSMGLRDVWDQLPGELRQFSLYVVCGVTAVALDFAIYSVLLSFGVWYQGANAVGYVFGTLLSFALNRVITFKVLDAPGKRLALFLGVASVGYLSSVLSLWLMIEQLEIEPIAAKLVSIAIVVAIQYTLNSRLTFR